MKNHIFLPFTIIGIVLHSSCLFSQEFAEPYLYSSESFVVAHDVYSIKQAAPNNSTTNRLLTGVSIKIVDWEPDLSAKPVFEIFPFAGRICVQVTNVGWGDFDGGQLKLSQLDYSNREHISQITDEPKQLGVVKSGEQKQVLFGDCSKLGFRITTKPNNPRYSLTELSDRNWEVVNISPGILDAASRRQFSTREANVSDGYTSGSFSRWIPRDSYLDEFRVSSTTSRQCLEKNRGFLQQFTGQIEKTGKTHTVPYYARQFQPVDLTSLQSERAELLRANFEGGLANEWRFSYGDISIHDDHGLSAGMSSGLISKITASFGKPTNGKVVNIPVPRIPMPSNGIDFELEIHCAVPGKFKLQIQHEYTTNDQFGRETRIRPPFDWVKNEEKVYRVSLPKNYKLDWGDTQKTIGDLLKLDANLRDALVKASLPKSANKQLYPGTYSERLARSTLWCNLLLSRIVEDEESEQLAANLSDTHEWIIRFLDELNPNSTVKRGTRHLFWKQKNGEEVLLEFAYPEMEIIYRSLPILMKHKPEDAALLVARLYELRMPGILAKAVCFDDVAREIKEKHGSRLRNTLVRQIEKLKTPDPYRYSHIGIIDEEDVLAAALVDYPQWSELGLVLESNNTHLLGYCHGLTSHPQVKILAQKILNDYLSKNQPLGAEDNAFQCQSLVSGLTVVGSRDALSAVHQVAREAMNRNDIEVLKSCINYFAQFSTSRLDQTLMNQLARFPTSYTVRKMAAELYKKNE